MDVFPKLTFKSLFSEFGPIARNPDEFVVNEFARERNQLYIFRRVCHSAIDNESWLDYVLVPKWIGESNS